MPLASAIQHLIRHVDRVLRLALSDAGSHPRIKATVPDALDVGSPGGLDHPVQFRLALRLARNVAVVNLAAVGPHRPAEQVGSDHEWDRADDAAVLLDIPVARDVLRKWRSHAALYPTLLTAARAQ